MKRKGIYDFIIFLVALFIVYQLVAFLDFRTDYITYEEDGLRYRQNRSIPLTVAIFRKVRPTTGSRTVMVC